MPPQRKSLKDSVKKTAAKKKQNAKTYATQLTPEALSGQPRLRTKARRKLQTYDHDEWRSAAKATLNVRLTQEEYDDLRKAFVADYYAMKVDYRTLAQWCAGMAHRFSGLPLAERDDWLASRELITGAANRGFAVPHEHLDAIMSVIGEHNRQGTPVAALKWCSAAVVHATAVSRADVGQHWPHKVPHIRAALPPRS